MELEIAYINKSTLLNNTDADKITQAIQIQMDVHWAVVYNRDPPTVRFYADETQVPATAYLMVFFDDADQAGALGYHTEDAGGRKYGKVFVKTVLDAGGGVLDGGTIGMSVASVASHEGLEIASDPCVNVYVDGDMTSGGPCYALEIADPVEANSYVVTLLDGTEVLVSAFVTPAWFDGAPPSDAVFTYPPGIVTRPFMLAPNGYCVVRTAPGTETQIFGMVPPADWYLKMKEFPASRTARRMKK